MVRKEGDIFHNHSTNCILLPENAIYQLGQRSSKATTLSYTVTDLANGVLELTSSNDHLHLEDVSLTDTSFHQLLQHLLAVQPTGRIHISVLF